MRIQEFFVQNILGIYYFTYLRNLSSTSINWKFLDILNLLISIRYNKLILNVTQISEKPLTLDLIVRSKQLNKKIVNQIP
jgi:hypothetical protein